MKETKRISIDTNFNWLGPCKPIVHPFKIEFFQLKEGDPVIGFQDEDEWQGIIGYDSSCPEEKQWYLDISNSKDLAVSRERMEGREEGALAALPIGEIRGEVRVVTAMLKDGMDSETVLKYTRLSRTRVLQIKKQIEES